MDKAKITVVKIIFHVLFLVLEIRERRKWNKLPTLYKFISFGDLVGLFSDRRPKVEVYGTGLKLCCARKRKTDEFFSKFEVISVFKETDMFKYVTGTIL